MARMIPPVIDLSSPPGERLLFQRLADDPETQAWTVLHSLGIARHPTQTMGEADFVIVIPGQGVVVLEVKSHSRVSRRPDGIWCLGSDDPVRRGPFEQSGNAMHAIRAYVGGRGVSVSGLPMVSGVWFTNARARSALPPSPEWHDWQLLDANDLRGDVSTALMRVISHGRAQLTASGLSFPDAEPTPELCEQFVRVLRPRFDLVESPADRRHQRAAQLLHLLEEQYEVLDAMAENRSCLFNGPAGSGKTLLAMEQARREAASGQSGWLVCFNRLLGMELNAMCGDVSNLRSGTLASLMLSWTGLVVPPDAGTDFWEGTLVTAALDRLLQGDLTRNFLIVDEAQDVLRDPYWDVLDLMVDGGLSGGRCIYFGDFVQQALYGTSDGRLQLRERATTVSFNRLSANCRNLPRIGNTAQALSSMLPGYSRYRRMDDGIQPTTKAYRSLDEQQALLVESVRLLRAEGFALEDVVVLSPRRQTSAAAMCEDPWLSPLLTPLAFQQVRGRVRFGTIHAFKGLESSAVIVTDFDDPAQPGLDSLLYVGLTRATDRLVVLGSREVLASRLEEGH
jgi:hypothetical protein